MKRQAIFLLVLLFGLAATAAQAREVNSFTVSDGQASYTFALAETAKKLFFYSYQSPSYGDMRSTVYAYAPLGPAPLDNPVMRAEVAGKVRGLFINELARLDTMNPVELPHGLACYSAILNLDGTCNSGVGLRFTIEKGTIKQVEVAMSNCCALDKRVIEDYEAKKPGGKGKKGQ